MNQFDNFLKKYLKKVEGNTFEAAEELKCMSMLQPIVPGVNTAQPSSSNRSPDQFLQADITTPLQPPGTAHPGVSQGSPTQLHLTLAEVYY